MSWTFHPPPGWPVPPGWQPPPGWTPDPAWPPPPAGWAFWVPAGTAAAPPPVPPAPPSPPPVPPAPPSQPPGPVAPLSPFPPPGPPPPPPQWPAPAPAPPAGPRPWHQHGWAIAGALLSVLLVGCVIGGLGAVLTDSDEPAANDNGPGAPPPPPAAAPSDPADPAPPGPDGLGPGEERTGSGPAIVALDLPPGELHTVTLSHSGEGVFSARLLDTAGEFGRGLAIGSGDLTGTYPVELRAFGEPGSVDITDADGTWTIAIDPLAEAPLWPDQTSGSGATVLRVDPDADASQVAVTHNGVSNVFMWGHVEGDYEELMVNEIGEWSGEADLRPDTFVLEIDADGEWTVEPA